MQTQIRYYARKLKIKEIPWKIAKQFTTKYHRDGMPTKVGGNKIAYGLYNDELLAVAMFCNPSTEAKLREYTTELIRLTFKTDIRIIGGASKLIKQYIKEKNPWDLFTYQDTSGENTNVYQYAGMCESTKKIKSKYVIVKNGYTYEDAKQATQKNLWFSIAQVMSHGPALIGSDIGEHYIEGQLVSNVELFTMPKYNLGYHIEEIPGDRLFEWRNPYISFYIYKITSTVSDGYYIGRHVQHMSKDKLKQHYKKNPQIDSYMGSGGVKFKNWINKVGPDTLKKEILEIVATHKQASYQEKKYIDLTDPCCKNQKTGDAAQPHPPVFTTCEKCGTSSWKHKENCPFDTFQACSECGSRSPGLHKNNCSHFKPISTCKECGGPKGRHKKTCSQFKEQKCPECGGVPGSHYKNCSQAKRPECSECGGTTQSHKKTCSQYVPRKKCPECGSGNLGAHKKTCSHYVSYQSLCDECGAPKSTHKRECSKYKPIIVCKECHKRNGNHTTACSHNNS
mgnify:CR=1 FL=1